MCSDCVSVLGSLNLIQRRQEYLLKLFLVLENIVFKAWDNLQTLLTDELLINPCPKFSHIVVLLSRSSIIQKTLLMYLIERWVLDIMIWKQHLWIRLSKELSIRIFFNHNIGNLLGSFLLNSTLNLDLLLFLLRISEPVKMNARKCIMWDMFLLNESRTCIGISRRKHLFGIFFKFWNKKSGWDL